MKKIVSLLLAAIVSLSVFGFTASADSEPVNVNVTIADNNGKLVLTQKSVSVTDVDNDGAITINDALYIAHEENYKGGAKAGYASANTVYGLSLNKLWGVANGGSYGYYVNNIPANSLADTVKNGDYINAFCYTDLTSWSDKYCFFDKNVLSAKYTDTVSLTLKSVGYDEAYNTIELPVKDAIITLNGKKTKYKTDSNGKVDFKMPDGGLTVISAVSDSEILVPPVAVATVSTPNTADVYVTVVNDKGKVVLTQKKVTVKDIDNDGAITINDALYVAHEENYKGGAKAGYASANTVYGLSLNKLWGVANGGSYGYYVNNIPANSLADAVKNGDYINAFCYTDLTSWSDKYCYFDKNVVETTVDTKITLTLKMADYDAVFNPISVPVENAIITINGEKTEYVTDENGMVTFSLPKSGTYSISAVSESLTLVPPVLSLNAKQKSNSLNNKDEQGNGSNNSSSENNEDEDKQTKGSTTVTNNDGQSEYNETITSPKTGENASVYLMFFGIMGISAVGILTTLKRRDEK